MKIGLELRNESEGSSGRSLALAHALLKPANPIDARGKYISVTLIELLTF
jgi:hypothetical protein